MNNTLTFDFSVDRQNNNISIKREYAAPLAVVWNAYTKSEILDQWWAPKPWKAKTISMSFKEGGHWYYAMVGPSGEEHFAWTDYEHIEFQKKFIAHDGFADKEGNIEEDMPQSDWEVSFTDKGQTTLVEFLISFDEPAQLDETINMGFKEGLSKAMEGLDELLPSLKE